MKEILKQKINKIIKDYKTLFPYEMEAFKIAVRQKVELQTDKFAKVKNSDYILRQLAEYPENLYTMFLARLDEEEKKDFFDKKGMFWLIKEHPEFKITDKV